MEKAFEELQIKDDFMFGIVMRNPKLCKPFLERVLGIKIEHIEYPKQQESINISTDAKSVRLDIYVEDGKNSVYNIEMQTVHNKNIPKRSRYYQGMIDLNILERGRSYRELKQSFVIFVCTFDLFGEGRHVYTFENRCIQNLELGFGDGTTKVILNTKGLLDDITPELKCLLDFVDGGKPKDDFTKELDEAVRSIRKNEKWRVDYMTLQMHYEEKFEEGMEKGIEKGMEEGIEKGIEQEKKQLAQKMLEIGELPLEKVALYSGLSLEEIREMKKKLQFM